MAGLLALLERESRDRGKLSEEEALTPETAFALVRDMPYRRASSLQPEAIIRDWRGTCSGKHYLLADVFRESALESQVVMGTHRFTVENTQHFPAELRYIVKKNPVPDVYTYLLVKMGARWTVIDATWPRSSESLGMPVNQQFDPGINMAVACDPIETFEVPAGKYPHEFKEQPIEAFCGLQSKDRDHFIDGMGRWLSKNT